MIKVKKNDFEFIHMADFKKLKLKAEQKHNLSTSSFFTYLFLGPSMQIFISIAVDSMFVS